MIATKVYGASGVEYSPEADQCLTRYEAVTDYIYFYITINY